MSLIEDSEKAAEYIELLQQRLWSRNDHSQDDDLTSIICMLESPMFKQLLTIQESLQELKHVSRTQPLTVDAFDITPSGELILNESSEGFSPESIADSSTLKLRGRPFTNTAPPSSSYSFEPTLESAIEKMAAGRPVHVIQLKKAENTSLGFSVVGIKNEERSGELGIFVRDMQPGGLAAQDGRLLEGDQLLAINGQPLEVSHHEAIRILQSIKGTAEIIVARGPPIISRTDLPIEGHLASKKREHMKAQSMKLPELIKPTCLDARSQLLVSPAADMRTPRDTPQISVTDEDAESPPGPSDDIVTPSLPDSFLGKLGLSATNSAGGTQISIDELSEKEVESKFVTLSLAYKTDKHTLDKRVSSQERARDLAEQNVDIELKDLKHAIEALSEIVSDVAVRSLLQKIKLHIDVLQQATARVSSRAEVFGAVQQERRLCKAMEVMIQYTENLRRVREKEELELNEARKLLSERSGNSLSVDSDSGPNKRSLSVCGYSAAGRMSSAMSQTTNVITNAVNAAGDFTQCASMRRRSEVALPKIIGGAGSPSLTPNTSQEVGPPVLGHTNSSDLSLESEDREDPKSRFQSAIASTSMQNIVATTMKHCSLEKQLSAPSSTSVSSSAYQGNASSASWSIHKEPHAFVGDKLDCRMSKDEEAFRKGFEEGLKTRLSHELTDLRDQQNSFSHSLEHMIDRVEQSQMEDEEYFNRPSRLISALSLVSTVGGHMLRYDWRSNKNIVRNLAGVLFLILACLVVYFSPPLSTNVKHFTKPPQ